MEIDDILKLIDAVASRDVAEFSLESEGSSLKIVRGRPAPPPPPLPAGERKPAETRGSVEVEVEKAAPVDPKTHLIKSPIVGTFYASPGPSAEPYVKTGDRIKMGQVLCIVEAMKLMNEIESDVSGVVQAMLVENGQPVEYGEGLLEIRLDG